MENEIKVKLISELEALLRDMKGARGSAVFIIEVALERLIQIAITWLSHSLTLGEK
jgi:hypothetical protein